MAAAYLLEKVSWTGISSDFKIELTAARTRQFSDAMKVSKDLMANLLLAAGGRGGSNGELTNWDGTKKRLVGQESRSMLCFQLQGKVIFFSVFANFSFVFLQKSNSI